MLSASNAHSFACTSLVVSQPLHRLAPFSYAASSGHTVAARSLLRRPGASTSSAFTAPTPTGVDRRRLHMVFIMSPDFFLSYFQHRRPTSQGNLQGDLTPSQVSPTTHHHSRHTA